MILTIIAFLAFAALIVAWLVLPASAPDLAPLAVEAEGSVTDPLFA